MGLCVGEGGGDKGQGTQRKGARVELERSGNESDIATSAIHQYHPHN